MRAREESLSFPCLRQLMSKVRIAQLGLSLGIGR
jgi:hypothetical protein